MRGCFLWFAGKYLILIQTVTCDTADCLGVYLSKHPEEELDAYVNTYLKEEILAEGLIRRLPPFSRLLLDIGPGPRRHRGRCLPPRRPG